MTDEHIKIIEELKQNAVYNQMSNEIMISNPIEKLQVKNISLKK